MTATTTKLIVGIPGQLDHTARLIAAARGEDINDLLCATLRTNLGAVPQ